MSKNWHKARYLLSGAITHVLRVHDGEMMRLSHNAGGEGLGLEEIRFSCVCALHLIILSFCGSLTTVLLLGPPRFLHC